GFDVARVDAATATHAKMGESVRLKLVDAETPLEIDDVLITADSVSPLPRWGEGKLTKSGSAGVRAYTLQISLTPAETTHLDGNILSLAGLNGSQQVGAAQLAKVIGGWRLTAHEIHDLPRRTLPDPT